MKVNRKILKIKSHAQPLNLFDLDKENLSFTLGNNSGEEDLFLNEPSIDQLKLMCELVPVQNFPKGISYQTRYHKKVGQQEPKSFLKKEIYEAPLRGFVSSIDLVFKESLTESLPKDWLEFLSTNNKLFAKNFLVQQQTIEEAMTEDPRYESNMYHHLVSKAFPFGGLFHKSIPIDKIEQYFFYVGTGLKAEEYLETISSRDLLSGSFLSIAPGIKSSQITSLKDDIVSGKVTLTFPDETEYQSVDIRKDTVISNLCLIIFRRKQ